jgi:hypothetical protein
VTKAQQEFEVAKLEAEKAEQVARKVRAEGEAEAAIAAAKVRAGLTPEQKAKIHKDMMVGIAHEFANAKTDLVPKIIVNGGSANGSDPMQAVGFNMLLQLLEKIDKMTW